MNALHAMARFVYATGSGSRERIRGGTVSHADKESTDVETTATDHRPAWEPPTLTEVEFVQTASGSQNPALPFDGIGYSGLPA